ncbi:NADH:flavin oxidoreductase [Niveispirillum fermenti]|uniref:NADH:flavin oxidoreductase n=1 Tax=Niveispirillum fermenti TaxID=1233113 RepID=UPI003A845C9C
MNMPVSVAPLFRPFRAGGLDLPNRIVMAPMTRWRAPGQYPGADIAAYYRRRAQDGVGLIITEGTTIDHPVASHSERTPAFHGRALEGWQHVVTAVKAAGGRIVPQLWHVGAMRPPSYDAPNRDLPVSSPSGIAKPGGRPIADPMTVAGITAVIDAFVRAALDARRLGFDGIEIHGAHGYIVDQFLWDALNRRTDAYGGGLDGRNRFAVELVTAVRVAIGPDFPLILRLSQWKQQDYAARLATSPDELAAIVQPLAAAGVDVFHCSQRRWWEPEFPGSPLNLAGWVKRLTGRPVISVGSVGLGTPMSVTEHGADASVAFDPAPLADALTRGDFDLIAVGRALLADPQWCGKVRAGRFDDLVPYGRDVLDRLE